MAALTRAAPDRKPTALVAAVKRQQHQTFVETISLSKREYLVLRT